MRADEIALLLPEVFRRTLNRGDKGDPSDVLSALLEVMSQMQARDEAILNHLDWYFNPGTVPGDKKEAEPFLFFLARWVDLDWLLPVKGDYEADLGCLRRLILAAPQLARARGTNQGLEGFLETATGVKGFTVKEDQGQPFHIRVCCPATTKKLRPLVERIIRGERPAYTIYDLVFE